MSPTVPLVSFLVKCQLLFLLTDAGSIIGDRGAMEQDDVDTLVSRIRSADASGLAVERAAVLTEADLSLVESFHHSAFAEEGDLQVLAVGIAASPGAASGEIVLTSDQAIAISGEGRSVILVRTETTPDDVHGMQASTGVLTSRGGIASHAAVVARGWGIPAVVGVGDMVVHEDGVTINGRRLRVGEFVSLDGASGRVFAGGRETASRAIPAEFEVLSAWAERVIAGKVSVRANADTAADAAHARSVGAQGIGLCRTEHMFLRAGRLELIRKFILSEDGSSESSDALERLEEAQTDDFFALLTAMDGLPVTVRLLDPPLHEFLPSLEPLVVAEATDSLDDDGRRVISMVRRLHESNPMIGTRGVRLAVLRPGLYEMQVRAVARAAARLAAAGGSPHVEIMVPLVVDEAELRRVRAWVEGAWRDAVGEASVTPLVGAMIETPRAALLADRLAAHADFFSFGTNDLTQLTFGLSRDDVEVRLMPAYLSSGLFADNPFAVLDGDGVGSLIASACGAARAVKSTLRLSACGEHAGDPRSIRVLLAAGCDSLSCSPPRVRVAILAAARELLLSGAVDDACLAGSPALRMAVSPVEKSVTTESLSGVGVASAPTPEIMRHAIRVRGFVTRDGFVEYLGGEHDDIDQVLDGLVANGDVRLIESRGLYQLTPQGTAAHRESLHTLMVGTDRQAVRDLYETFLELNSAFKELCTRWQTRDGRPNPHDDLSYDAECVSDLGGIVGTVVTLCSDLAVMMPRFDTYAARLQEAASRVVDGDQRFFTGVACGSAHDVWMEIHEDLVQMLGIDRVAEGSF